MLRQLRDALGHSIAGTAAALGVPTSTLRRWLNGNREASGAAQRLIWLLHTAIFHAELLRTGPAWQLWLGSRAETLAAEGQLAKVGWGSLGQQIRAAGAASVSLGAAFLAGEQISEALVRLEEESKTEGLGVKDRLSLLRQRTRMVVELVGIVKEMVSASRLPPAETRRETQGGPGPRARSGRPESCEAGRDAEGARGRR